MAEASQYSQVSYLSLLRTRMTGTYHHTQLHNHVWVLLSQFIIWTVPFCPVKRLVTADNMNINDTKFIKTLQGSVETKYIRANSHTGPGLLLSWLHLYLHSGHEFPNWRFLSARLSNLYETFTVLMQTFASPIHSSSKQINKGHRMLLKGNQNNCLWDY